MPQRRWHRRSRRSSTLLTLSPRSTSGLPRNGTPPRSGGRCLRRAGKSNRDEETAGGAGCEVEGPVVCLDDAVHDGQPEADAGMLVGAYAFCSALEGFGEGRY